MTAATYNDAKPRKITAKPVRARAARAKTTPLVDETPIFSGVPAYSRIHERKSSRLPLIAGGIAVVATIALVAGTSRTAHDAEPFTPTQTASAPAAMATAPVQPNPVAAPEAPLAAPPPAPVRQQARVIPRATTAAPAPAPFDATQLGQDASTSAPVAPAAPTPITVPPVQSAPEVEAAPVPQSVEPEAAAPVTPEPMSNWGASTGAKTVLSAV